jgi:hypothetical protein
MNYSFQRMVCPASQHGLPEGFPRLFHGRRSSDENLLGGLRLFIFRMNRRLPADLETLKNLGLYEYSAANLN